MIMHYLLIIKIYFTQQLEVFDKESNTMYTHEPDTRDGTDKIGKQTKDLEFQTKVRGSILFLSVLLCSVYQRSLAD